MKLIVFFILLSTCFVREIYSESFEGICSNLTTGNARDFYFDGDKSCMRIFPTSSYGNFKSAGCKELNGKKGRLLTSRPAGMEQIVEKFNSTIKSGAWLWDGDSVNSWSADVNKTDWDTGMPDNSKSCACLHVPTMKYRTTDCSDQYPIICEYTDPRGKDTYSFIGGDKKGKDTSVIKEFTAIHRLHCAVICNKINDCKAMSYNDGTGHCQLLYHSSSDVTPDTVTSYDFYDRS